MSAASYPCRHRSPGATPPGGVTRILIIDDDHRPDQPPRNGDAIDGPSSDISGLPVPPDFEGRPVVHELQVPTSPESGPPGNHTEDLGAVGHPDASVVRELIARVEELLHRTRTMPAGASSGWAGTIRFGSVLLEPATQTVLRGGQPVRVTHTEFRLLLALMRRRGAIASRMELLREVWGAGAAVSRRAVDTHIARLRRKLEDDPANPRHILTALAWGYRFRP
ncbi:MAG TPA: response regulator transcription factor [Gemmatimonadales bacterium]